MKGARKIALLSNLLLVSRKLVIIEFSINSIKIFESCISVHEQRTFPIKRKEPFLSIKNMAPFS